MIKINSFYPFSNFLRVISEFHEDKALVKMKSLTFEREYEFEYQQIAEITHQSEADNNQMRFGFRLLVILGATFTFLFSIVYARPLLFQTIQGLYVISVILFLTSFIKSQSYYFLDGNKKILIGIKVTSKNSELVLKAIELAGKKSENVQKITFDHPFPESQSLFELTNYDAPNYLNKRQTCFYEDRLIVFDKSIIGANVSSHRYDQLSGEVYRGRQGNHSWDSLCWLMLAFSMIVLGFYIAFNILTRVAFLSIMGILAAVWIISFLLKYVKREIIAFYNKNHQFVYFTWVDQSSKEKIEEIIKFVQTRISSGANGSSLKEQA